jgi:hypothetical protein
MRSYLQQSNGLDALLKSTGQHIFCKRYLSLPNMCFIIMIWQNMHRESQKMYLKGEYLVLRISGSVVYEAGFRFSGYGSFNCYLGCVFGCYVSMLTKIGHSFTLMKSTRASRCQGSPILCRSDDIFKNCKKKPTPQ